jgi:acetylornithine deacetylase
MKAADATFVSAAKAVMKAGIKLKGDVALALVCGELRGGAGARHALEDGVRADYFVLGEPTNSTSGSLRTARPLSQPAGRAVPDGRSRPGGPCLRMCDR